MSSTDEVSHLDMSPLNVVAFCNIACILIAFKLFQEDKFLLSSYALLNTNEMSLTEKVFHLNTSLLNHRVEISGCTLVI